MNEDTLEMKRFRLEALNSKLRSVAYARNELQAEVYLEESTPMVGRCYVYRNNSYSCPHSEEDYWDVYLRVVRVDQETGSAFGVRFQRDSQGRFEVKEEPFILRDGWDEVTYSEWALAWEQFETEMRLLITKEVQDVT